ncbi:MAG: hypothetical protein DMG60_10435 [Acidobacteria bacterium]|nr:MAG: hypothetical protein DMG60_10435 [Acidobacteriota bacterium]
MQYAERRPRLLKDVKSDRQDYSNRERLNRVFSDHRVPLARALWHDLYCPTLLDEKSIASLLLK